MVVILVRELFTLDRLARVRELVRWAAKRVGLSNYRTESLLQAVNEATNNAILYGGGHGYLEMVQDNGTQLTARIIDDGPGMPELPTVSRPGPMQTHGRGRWLMYEYCDRVRFLTGPRGTTVELDMALHA